MPAVPPSVANDPGRIIGGVEAIPNSSPWQVGLLAPGMDDNNIIIEHFSECQDKL